MNNKIRIVNEMLVALACCGVFLGVEVSCKDSRSQEMGHEEHKVHSVVIKAKEQFSLSPAIKESIAYEMKFHTCNH